MCECVEKAIDPLHFRNSKQMYETRCEVIDLSCVCCKLLAKMNQCRRADGTIKFVAAKLECCLQCESYHSTRGPEVCAARHLNLFSNILLVIR